MIQRIQTLYLLFSLLIWGLMLFALNFDRPDLGDRDELTILDCMNYIIYVLLIGSLVTIFSFRKLKIQMILTRINILMRVVVLIVFLFALYMYGGSNPDIREVLIPIVIVLDMIFLFLSLRGIIKDYRIIKYSDRIR
ncbi:DUF4293 family protein [Ichthyobacterium seriolicida]|nr:DUF4293 family protein [Ichthyobacterium seriolicida]